MPASAFLYDVNLWVALTFSSHPHHRQAQVTFASATPAQPALFCRATQQSFLRLASTPAILQVYGATGLTNHDALTMLTQFMALPQVRYQEKPPGIAPMWHHLAGCNSASPKVWMDAYIAAFAIVGDFQLVTFDRDFKPLEKDGLNLLLL